MARAPNENLEKAFKLYKKGFKLVDISKELNIPAGTIRRWKSTYKWDGERSDKKEVKSERSVKKDRKENAKKKCKEKVIAEEVKEVLQNTELTDKQRLFCIYHIEDFNATKAYQKAYGCSYDTARVNGSKLLTNTNIKKEIDRLTEECLNEQEVSSKLLNKRLFEMYMKIAFADIGDYLKFGQEEEKVWSINEDGDFKPVIDPETGEQRIRKYNIVNLNESEEVDTTIISEVSEGKDGIKIKLLDKMKALEWLDKHYGEGTQEQKLRIEMLRSKINQSEGQDDKLTKLLKELEKNGY